MIVLRVGAGLIAAATAALLVIGDHPIEFVVADLLVVTGLVVAAILPGRAALPALAVGFGIGLGVFTTAFSAAAGDGVLNWSLAAAVVGCSVGIVLSLRGLAVRFSA
ncbi:hypothetical protein [Kribbella albertanoniae]|uniref:Uncharacterized protein n=1 Tax=Kribbella albertanoniae TaxID=1266829 RepID=A0A4R4QIX6_9ACTN|nr:hypothetical protein [Kribbella albertanoniae]TDC35319.1 hypothetical protein E1261_01975 [Kribbella albertanoniae]